MRKCISLCSPVVGNMYLVDKRALRRRDEQLVDYLEIKIKGNEKGGTQSTDLVKRLPDFCSQLRHKTPAQVNR